SVTSPFPDGCGHFGDKSQRDFASKPRVAESGGYPGSQDATFSTLKGLRLAAASDVASFLQPERRRNPVGVVTRNEHPPRVVALLQPWAVRRNPFGICREKCPNSRMFSPRFFGKGLGQARRTPNASRIRL